MDRVSFPLDDVPLRSLRIFIAVADAENFSAVSRQMRISVSNVSKQIGLLEEAVGVPLVYRTTRKVSVTEAGRQFYDRCVSILATIDEATSSKGIGHIRISAPPSVTSAILSPRVSDFLSDHTDVTVDFFVASALPDIVRHRIDAAIVLREWPGIKAAHKMLGKMKRILCASPEYLVRHGKPAQIEDLSDHRCVMSLLAGDPEPWTFRKNGRRKTAPVTPIMASDNGDCIRQACLSGVGIANLYEFHARDDLIAGNLVEVLPDSGLEEVGLYVIMPHKGWVNSPTAAFIEFLEDVIDGYR